MFETWESNLNKIIKVYIKIIFFICSVTVFTMFSLLFVQVISRTFLNTSYFWLEELARFIMIFMTLVGSVLGFKYGTHPRLRIVFRRLSQKNILKWELILRALCFSLLAIFLIRGWSYAHGRKMLTTGGLGISLKWPLLILPIGSFTIMVYFLLDTIKVLLYQKSDMRIKELKLYIDDFDEINDFNL